MAWTVELESAADRVPGGHLRAIVVFTNDVKPDPTIIRREVVFTTKNDLFNQLRTIQAQLDAEDLVLSELVPGPLDLSDTGPTPTPTEALKLEYNNTLSKIAGIQREVALKVREEADQELADLLVHAKDLLSQLNSVVVDVVPVTP